MHCTYLFLFCLIFIVGVICCVGDLPSSVAVVSLVTNFIVLALCWRKLDSFKQTGERTSMFKVNAGEDAAPEPHGTTPATSNPKPPEEPLYTPEFEEEYESVRNSYLAYPKTDTRTSGVNIDDRLARLRRDRDKQCIEGHVVKNANFYSHHYGTEFEESENKEWWGHTDY